MAQDAAKLLILQAAQVPLRRTYSPHPHVADGPLSARQANLESVVGQLDAKTNEVTAATQEAATQKAFVQQITKKLDVLSKRCKTLEQENTRMCEAKVGMMEAEVQTEPDAVLLQAQADTAAVQESLRDAKYEKVRSQKAYNDALRTYSQKLVDLGIPSPEIDAMGFTLLPSYASSGPAGLVVQ